MEGVISVRVGIPRSLSFFSDYPLWKSFFEELGAEVIVSPPTNRKIMDDGVREAVNDACVPIKLYHGHVAALKDRVDILFVPRLVSLDGKVTMCPKFLGLPEMVKYSLKGLPETIDSRLDLRRGWLELYRFMYRVGMRFTENKWKIWRAIWVGRNNLNVYRKLLLQGMTPDEAFKVMYEGKASVSKCNKKIEVLVLGYPYALYDRYTSAGLIDKVKAQGVKVLTPEMICWSQLKKAGRLLKKNMFWYYSNRVAWAALYHLGNKSVDAIIHVTAFGCGPDAMTNKLVELEVKKRSDIPFMSVTIDEHTGETGVATRVEAFVDLLKRKRGEL